MQTVETKTSSAASNKIQKKQQPFFNKEGEGSFFSKSNESSEAFFGPNMIQPKLTIGQPNDKYEVEADAMADAVVNKSSVKPDIQNKKISNIQRESLATSIEDEKLGTAEQRMEEDKLVQEKPLIQKKCSTCEEEELQKKEIEEEPELNVQQKPIFESNLEPQETIGLQAKPQIQTKCATCEGEEELQPKNENHNTSTAYTGVESKISSSKGKGAPLSSDVQTSMNDSFAADFSNVRVHTGSDAIQMNKELGAQAFTNGNDIYFNQGKYDTNSSSGKHLLAHELTHTIQQNSGQIKRKEQQTLDSKEVKVHTGQKAKELTEERMADAVTLKNDIYVHPDNVDSDNEVDEGLLNHELTHVEQQKKYSTSDISNIDTYSKLENEAIKNESVPSIQRQENDLETSVEDREASRLNKYKERALNELDMMQRIVFMNSNIDSFAKYDSFMKKAARSSAAYIKSKLLESWVDDDDEASVLRELRRWAKILKSDGGNYLDIVLDYLRNHSLHMDYLISESISVTFLEQLYEEMEGGNKSRLYFIIDTYSAKYTGYRGRGGVSMFGSFSTSMMNSTVKKKISSLNRQVSGLSTIPMEEGEIKRINELYGQIKSKTLGLVDLPRITIAAAEGQNAAQIIAIPVITVALVLEALLIALIVVLVLALIIELLDILAKAIGRARAKPRTKPRNRRKKFKKAFKWDSRINVKTVLASRGKVGALDISLPFTRGFPWHGHHPWPKFMGGAGDQRLMGVRELLHLSILHPGLLTYLKGLGHNITSQTSNPKNVAFIARLKTDPVFRLLVKTELLTFYAAINLVTSPKMPITAYSYGISDSFRKL